MSDLEKRVEHWLEYGKEYRWSNEFMTFLSDVKTAFLAPREEEPEIRLRPASRYLLRTSANDLRKIADTLDVVEQTPSLARPAPADALRDWAEHTASFLREWRKPPRLDPDDMADYGQQLQGEADELISEYAALREGAKEGT